MPADRRHGPRVQDLDALVNPEVESHLRQLDADVRVEAVGGDPLDRGDVLGRRPVR